MSQISLRYLFGGGGEDGAAGVGRVFVSGIGREGGVEGRGGVGGDDGLSAIDLPFRLRWR